MRASKITLHMVSSLDGFIAKKDGTISWMESVDHYEKGIKPSEEFIVQFLNAIDCYVMGSRTYEHANELGWPYGDKPVYVLSSRDLASNGKNVFFHSGSIDKLVNKKLRPAYGNIWVVGGATIAKEFMVQGLVDELIVSILPVILGDGLLFFDAIGKEQRLHLKNVAAYKDGMVELTYEMA